MSTRTLHFRNASDKKKYNIWRSICAIGVIIGFACVFYWVSIWTKFSIGLDDEEDYESYRTPGECCETLDQLEENYEIQKTPIIRTSLIFGIILVIVSMSGGYYCKKKYVKYES